MLLPTCLRSYSTTNSTCAARVCTLIKLLLGVRSSRPSSFSRAVLFVLGSFRFVQIKLIHASRRQTTDAGAAGAAAAATAAAAADDDDPLETEEIGVQLEAKWSTRETRAIQFSSAADNSIGRSNSIGVRKISHNVTEGLRLCCTQGRPARLCISLQAIGRKRWELSAQNGAPLRRSSADRGHKSLAVGGARRQG